MPPHRAAEHRLPPSAPRCHHRPDLAGGAGPPAGARRRRIVCRKSRPIGRPAQPTSTQPERCGPVPRRRPSIEAGSSEGKRAGSVAQGRPRWRPEVADSVPRPLPGHPPHRPGGRACRASLPASSGKRVTTAIRGGSSGAQPLGGRRQGIGAFELAQAHAAWALATGHPDAAYRWSTTGPIDSPGGRQGASGYLQMAQLQLRLDRRIKSRPRRLLAHRGPGQGALQAIERPSLSDDREAGSLSRGRPIHHIGYGVISSPHGAASNRAPAGRRRPKRRICSRSRSDQQQWGRAHTGQGHSSTLVRQPAPPVSHSKRRLWAVIGPAHGPLFPNAASSWAARDLPPSQPEINRFAAFILPGANGFGPVGALPSLGTPKLQLIHSILPAASN